MVQHGGSADKVGNDYEALWTVLRMCDLLDDTLREIRFEPPGVDGAELRVEDSTGDCFDQVKFRSAKPWSVRALVQDGLLHKLTNEYRRGARVQLVLSNGSPDFERLIVKARSAECLEEFRASTINEPNLGELQTVWQTDETGVWQNLQRTSLNSSRMDYLRDLALIRLDALVLGPSESVCALLKTWAVEGQQQTITGQILWNRLEKAGYQPQPRVGDQTNSRSVRQTLDRYVAAISAAESKLGMADRVDVGRLINSLDDPATRGLVIVHGRAGVGKSSVVSAAASHVAESGTLVAAIRLDGMPSGLSTARQLGEWVDLVGSPVVVLSRLTPKGSTSLLVVDQLDAVSDYSGRMPESFSAVDELVREARMLGNVRVLLVSRTVDMQHDQRIRRLAESEGTVPLEVRDLTEQDVHAVLRKNGIDPVKVDQSTMRLLRSPIHLSVFSRLAPEHQLASYSSLPQLYLAYTQEVRSRLTRTNLPDEWNALTATLVHRMADDEALSAPEMALQRFNPTYIYALVSESIITLESGRIRFFHETFFDFLFALNFEPRGEQLIDYFISAGKTLLRRAQLRQVLAYIATDTPLLFVPQVIQILESEMREHLKPIAISTLVEFEPNASDWDSVNSIVLNHGSYADSLVALLGRRTWFTVAEDHHDVERILDDESYGARVGLQIADGEAPLTRAIELLSSRRGRGDEWRLALRAIADRPLEPGLVQFATDGIAAGWFQAGSGPSDQIPWRLFHRLCDEDPESACRILGAYLGRSQIAVQSGDSIRSAANVSNSLDELEPLATAAPSQFVDRVLDFVIAAARPTASSSIPMPSWEYRSFDRIGRGFDEQLFYGLDEALRLIAPLDASRTFSIVGLLSTEKLRSLDFLACRMLQASELADESARWLLEREDRLAIGWHSDARWESRQLIKICSTGCNDDLYQELESKLLDFYPDWEREKEPESRRNRGVTQLSLITALPAERLSKKASDRVQELKRKFPHWTPTGPEQMTGGSVESPVAMDSSRRMTDANWVKAIDTHTGDETRWLDGKPVGGARELAQTFGALVKENPQRYVSLAISLESPNSEPYLEEAVRQSGGAIDVGQLTTLCTKLRTEYGEQGSRAISFAISQIPAAVDDNLVQLLIDMSSDRDPEVDRPPYKDHKTGEPQTDYAGAGLNSARGGVAAAIRSVLFAQPQRTADLLPTVVELAKDHTVAVRAMAAEAVLPIFNTDLPVALEIAQGLLESGVELYSTRGLVELLTWASFNDPNRFAAFVAVAIDGPNPSGAGSLWLNLYLRDALRPPISTDYMQLSVDARLGVAQTARHVPQRATDLLTKMFDDPSADVRKEASLAIGRLDSCSPDQSRLLVERFLDSATFEDNSRVLFTALTTDSQLLPTRIIEACSRFVAALENKAAARAPDYEVGQVAEVILRLYHQGDDQTRALCLDTIDRLTRVRAWGLERALNEER